MAATQQDIDGWIAVAKTIRATHIISVCDTFDWEDYPVYVMPHQKVDEVKKAYDGVNMQEINEVIKIK